MSQTLAKTTAATHAAQSSAAQASADGQPFRAAPHNIEAEQALLGAILVNNEAFDRVTGFLEAHHFFDPLHGQIFDTIVKLQAAAKPATPVTLRTFFETAAPVNPTLTVPQYLGKLATNATTVINARQYAQVIYDLSVRRQLIVLGEDMVNTAYDSLVDNTPDDQIEEAEGRLYSLAEKGRHGQGFLGFNAALTHAISMASAAYERDGGLSGISSGLKDLDSKMGGLQKSDLIILAGRPSMGKTALVTNIAFNVAKARMRSLAEKEDMAKDDAKHDGAVVGFFSLEMSAEQLPPPALLPAETT